MNAPQTGFAPEADASLEAIELELALQTQDLAAAGFETCVANAAEATGGKLLFHMPVEFMPGCQRIAAVLAGKGSDQRTVMVMLDESGERTFVEDAGNGNAFSGLASSYANLMNPAFATENSS